MLVSAGHIVSTAASVDAALRVVDDAAQPFELVLTDVVMPDQRGTVLAAKLEVAAPDLCVSFMSAYTDGEDDETGGRPMIRKPFLTTQLLGHINELMQDNRAGLP